MQRTREEIVDYFHEFIFGFIYHDIERCIEAKANYVVALALLSYTEYIGGLISGNLGLKDRGIPTSNFNTALEYFPKKYKDINLTLQVEYTDENGNTQSEKGIYSLFRCGMVHEYFVKGESIVYNEPYGHTKSHIGIIKNGEKLEFHTNEYFRDFRLAIYKIYKLLVMDSNPKLMDGFNNSLYRISSRKII
jgi:hypothetical protein